MKHDTATNTLTYAELSTILAALRLWQGGDIDAIRDIYLDDVEGLGDDEIDSLCERLNCGEIVRIEGGPKG
jgi:hypothetical protein